jgi:1-acyl-sn-glycerol-3-phosphate acyltransferase
MEAPDPREPGVRFEYRPMPDLDRTFIERLGDYPRGPDILLETLRWVGRAIVIGLLRLQYRVAVVGAPPAVDRYAMAANHQSHLDALAILAAMPRRDRGRVAVLAARDYFFGRWHRALAAGLFAQAVAFDRRRYTELRDWSRRLADQERGCLLCFPSGSRRSSETQRGLLVVIARSGWPIVPVALAGTREAWPVGAPLWRPFRKLRVTFGAPLDPQAGGDLATALGAFWREHGG